MSKIKLIPPTIIWHSDPVGPNETVVLNGDNFQADCQVKLKMLGKKTQEQLIKPEEQTSQSLKFIIPATWQQNIYSCQVKQSSGVSNEVFINAPDIWWCQGDSGSHTATPGGWLRIQGKCLVFDEDPCVNLIIDKKTIPLKTETISNYSVKANIPKDIPIDKYLLDYGNGFKSSKGKAKLNQITIKEKPANKEVVFNVCDLGADPTGKKDCTLAIVQATEQLGAYGGGVVYFPAGRYRIDSILRSGVFCKTPLKIPQNVTFHGESMELVSLWWPDQEEALPSLIEGSNNFTIEDLSIYTQGKHSTIITGESNVTINRVRIRANHYYMTTNNGCPHHKRGIKVDYMVGPAFCFQGENITVTNCDIFYSAACFDLRHTHGAYIANNTIMANNFFFFSGASEVILEKNQFTGNQLTTGGSNIALHLGAISNQNIYMSHNSISHIYGGDHEAFTLDGHLTAYCGKVKNIKANTLELANDLMPKTGFKGSMREIMRAALYIIDGKGRGQFRWIKDYEGNKITLDSPWQVDPDDNSYISIGGFNGRHLFIGNTMSDTGTTIQLYAPCHESIIAENKSIRASNINSLGRLRQFRESTGFRVELNWYNQFLDNEIIEGNCWGGGCTEVDRWIGGETCLQLWGWYTHTYTNETGAFQDEFLSAENLKEMLNEKKKREICLPMSLFSIIRRHKIHNNSSIRIRGRISEVLIENCEINNSAKGIRVDTEIDYEQPKDIGQLFDFEPTENIELLTFLSPDHIFIRNNKFNNVKTDYSGTAINLALIKN